jgi:hypothetical protein
MGSPVASRLKEHSLIQNQSKLIFEKFQKKKIKNFK